MADSNNDLNYSILNLNPQEKAAYSYLFKLADTDSIGVLTGERAVTFFEKTHVPAPVLGEIWQLADTENRGLLTKPGFCMVMRLIGCYQAGEQPRTELAFKPAPIPKFDGIAIPAFDSPVPPASPTRGQMPPPVLQPQLSGQSAGGGPIRIPPLDPAKVQQYSSLFEKSGAQNGMLDGGTAKSIFERSGLPIDVLGKIWMLSDREQSGALDQTEFIVAMHLLTSMKTRAMTALPVTLPPGLYEAAARRGQRPPSRQMSGASQAAIPRQFTGSQPSRTQSPLARSIPPAMSAMTTGPHWLVTAQEKAQYDRFFASIDTSGSGVISGEQAVRFFSDSRLPEDTLALIWDLADITSEGQLNKDEFAVAMYLIRQQRQPNASPLPAFLPPALVPPSMRGQAAPPAHSTAPAFDNPAAAPPSNISKSAAEDLFGLDDPMQPQAPVMQPQTTGASTSRDPFAGSAPDSPSSPQRFQSPSISAANTSFKPFVPTSAFGASLASQHTGGSVPPQQAARAMSPSLQQAPQPTSTAMDDLLGDNDASAAESSRLTTETTELANMSNQIGNLRTQMEQTQKKRSVTQADLTATNNQKKDLEMRLQQFRTQYETEVRTVKELDQQLAASKESTKKLGQELAMLEGTYQDLQTQHGQVSQAYQADQQENANLKQKIAQINAEVARLKPEVEKLKLDARQQKGLVSINKKQLTTNEGERDRLQSEKATLERDAAAAAAAATAAAAAEQTRSMTASPEPTRDVISPTPSTMSSTNPFFRKTTEPMAASSSAASFAPNPSAFDSLFGPSSAFAPNGQASSRSGTPPATSFIGRSLPTSESTVLGAIGGVVAGGLAGAGAASVFDSKDSPKEASMSTPAQEPPPPPVSRQFTASNLPITTVLGGEGSDASTSVPAIPPGSRAGDLDTPTASTPTPLAAAEREIPGAFPDDEPLPIESTGKAASSAAPPNQTAVNEDFDSAFASFGEGQASRDIETSDDPFRQSTRAPAPQSRGFSSEFPPIQNLERDDEDDSDSELEAEQNGFEDHFAPPQAEPAAEAATSITHVESIPPVAQEPPSFEQQPLPPTYEQSPPPGHIGTGQRTESNSFPPEFEGLLPAREDPTSPPPPAASPPVESAFVPLPQEDAISSAKEVLPSAGSEAQASAPIAFQTSEQHTSTEAFHDAASQPAISAFAPVAAEQPAATGRNAFDEFDDFNDLSEANEADKTASEGFDMDFNRQSVDEFNPAFDSPSVSMHNTPMAVRTMQQSSDSTNGFASFSPNVSTASAFGSTAQSGSTPQTAQHDWDAIFSGLDSSKDVDTSLQSSNDPWNSLPAGGPAVSAAAANGSTEKLSTFPQLGRAITPGTEHDDPILKRLTGMGYPRAQALSALEMHDYDINRAVDHLTGK